MELFLASFHIIKSYTAKGPAPGALRDRTAAFWGTAVGVNREQLDIEHKGCVRRDNTRNSVGAWGKVVVVVDSATAVRCERQQCCAQCACVLGGGLLGMISRIPCDFYACMTTSQQIRFVLAGGSEEEEEG